MEKDNKNKKPVPANINWIPIAEETPPNEESVLVFLEGKRLGTRVHTAMLHNNAPVIAGAFAWDCPKIKFWARIPNLPEGEEDK